MNEGYVKLWRKTLDSRVFQNEKLLKVFIWCLLRASHKKKWVAAKTGRGETEVEIGPGQFIFGRKAAAKQLKMAPSSVYKRIVKLKNLQKVNTQSCGHFTVITINKWNEYQNENRQVAGKEQASSTNKNVKNVKNKNLGAKLPSGFCVSDEMKKWFYEQNFQFVDIEQDHLEFKDYWKGTGATRKDWVATWRNWMRKAEKFNAPRYVNPKTKTQKSYEYPQCRHCGIAASNINNGQECPHCGEVA